MLIGKPSITQTLHKTSMNHPRRERSREYLAPDEIQKLLDASRKEGLSHSQRRLKEKIIHIHRLKNGNATTQPMYNGEVGAVNAWLKARHQMQPHSNFLFISERRKPLSRFTVCVLIKKYGAAAGLGNLEIHPHMLRHACGYSLANRGADTRLIQDYLGHKNITHTVRYTKLAPGRFTRLF